VRKRKIANSGQTATSVRRRKSFLDLPGDWRFLPKPGLPTARASARAVVNQMGLKSHVVLFETCVLTEILLPGILVQRTKIARPFFAGGIWRVPAGAGSVGGRNQLDTL
jgi:hypothetical protein